MADRRFLVLDIETILDRDLIRLVFGLPPDAGTAEIQDRLAAKYTNGFPPPPFHCPICVALIDVDHDSCKVHNAIVLENSDEKTLLQQFWKVVRFRKGAQVRSTLVHFNGRSFDLPVLFYRSLKHRVPVMNLEERSRYSFECNHDICDDLSDFGAVPRPSLNVISKMIGLPGKTDIDGSQIEDLYARGERTRIKDYCMEDALATYYVWLTIRFTRNQISQEKYDEAYRTAPELIAACRTATESYFNPA
jgi:predicted PolB exonuclease-like 3'-5' exonuclease